MDVNVSEHEHYRPRLAALDLLSELATYSERAVGVVEASLGVARRVSRQSLPKEETKVALLTSPKLPCTW